MPGRWQAAEDLAQQVLINVLKSRAGARWNPAGATVATWINRIVRNATISFLRPKKRKDVPGADLPLAF
jgi:DNA-directed RNA polymerase specialized sigma24 family protein